MNAYQPEFPTDLETIVERIEQIDPLRYARTRNYIDGAVTYLSPYISRGVISTKYVLERTLARGFEPQRIGKFIQELAWREYYQRTWQAKGELVDHDLRQPQIDVGNTEIPASLVEGRTGIEAIDAAVAGLYETGYIHNHIRMYIAATACNVAKGHWSTPARWMYYHLLDGDWASNALSWQWVAGTASSKKYFANQENIDRYCYTKQADTFLDMDYGDFDEIAIPDELADTTTQELVTQLPDPAPVTLRPGIPTLIYNSYNLDPRWHSHIEANRILLLEPSHFLKYPVSSKVIDFVLALGSNINGLQVFVGEFSNLVQQYNPEDIRFKEHPLCRRYIGTEESRDWMFDVAGYFPSFFSFWKKCERQLR